MSTGQNIETLLPINDKNGSQAVNARDLHAFLGIGRDFTNWMKDQIERCDLVEGQDYEVFKFDYQGRPVAQKGESDNQRVSKTEYAISIGAAKEISMMSQSEKGKQARRYFISCEEKLKSLSKRELSRKELALMVIQQEEEKERLMLENKAQQEIIESQKPAVVFTSAVQTAVNSCLIGELAKILKQNGVDMGEKRLFKWLREKKYLGSHGERYNIPNQEYIERGYFELKKGTRSGDNGVMHTTITPKVTGKGQVYFVNKFLSMKQ